MTSQKPKTRAGSTLELPAVAGGRPGGPSAGAAPQVTCVSPATRHTPPVSRCPHNLDGQD